MLNRVKISDLGLLWSLDNEFSVKLHEYYGANYYYCLTKISTLSAVNFE